VSLADTSLGHNVHPHVIRAAPNAILAPNFKFEDMGIGGLDTEFNEIFRRAFASRVFPPGLVEKLGIEHVKGMNYLNCSTLHPTVSLFARYLIAWTSGNRKDSHCPANWEDVECQRTEDCERPRNPK
jgi:hypothetical protein